MAVKIGANMMSKLRPWHQQLEMKGSIGCSPMFGAHSGQSGQCTVHTVVKANSAKCTGVKVHSAKWTVVKVHSAKYIVHTTVWFSSVWWACWNRSRWGERASELPRSTLTFFKILKYSLLIMQL